MKTALFSAAGLLAFNTSSALAAEEDEADDEGEKIVITGSRIKRTDTEGPAPVTVITAEDIKKQGHETIFDALNNLAWNTGQIQGEQDANSFTPNAQAINLRGFGQGRSLTLVNGRRLADYPIPLNGQSNFVNIATIPVAAVDRIEILSSGASAIYGSDAVAGVVNIILKDDLDYTEISYTRGQTKEGLGDSGDSDLFTVATGWYNDKFSITAGLEIRNTNPINGFDRDYLDSNDDAPDVDPGTRLGFGTINFDFSQGLILPSFGCDEISWQIEQEHRLGPYCGYNDVGENTIRNQRDKTSLFTSMTYELEGGDEVFADVIVFDQTAESNIFNMFYQPNYEGNISFRVFNSDETGNQSSRYDEDAFTVSIGLRGTIFNEHDYEVSLSTNQYDFESRSIGFLTTQIAQLIPTNEDLFRAYQPSDFEGVIADRVRGGESSIETLNFTLTGDIAELDAGPLAYAAVFEYASQDYLLSANQDVIEGNFTNGSNLVGGGDRDRSSVGVEFSIPLYDGSAGLLETQLATRYDSYQDDSATDDAVTYTASLTWRPTDSLLIRAGQATSFRAPDMHYLFAGDSTFFLNNNIDIYQCRTEDGGVDYPDNCIAHTQNVSGTRGGNLNLEEEEGVTNNIGIVYEPIENLSFSLDIYEIELENIVQDISVTRLLNDEANCLIGTNPSGSIDFDINSAFCQGVTERVVRFPDDDPTFPGEIDVINVSPENRALRYQRGADFTAQYSWDTESAGQFRVQLSHTYIDSLRQQQFSDEDPLEIRDIVDLDGGVNLKSRTNVTVSWRLDDFSASVFWNRVGSLPIQGAECFEDSDDPFYNTFCDNNSRLDAWKVTNLVLGYQATDNLSFRLNVNNVFNEEPIHDPTLGGWPWYQTSHHNPIGQEVFLNATYRFD